MWSPWNQFDTQTGSGVGTVKRLGGPLWWKMLDRKPFLQNRTCYCKLIHETTHCWGGHWPPVPTPLLTIFNNYLNMYDVYWLVDCTLQLAFPTIILPGLIDSMQIPLCLCYNVFLASFRD